MVARSASSEGDSTSELQKTHPSHPDPVPRARGSIQSDDHAFTDLMGNFLTFAVVSVTIYVMYSSGIGSLLQVQYAYQSTAAEQAMTIFVHNAEDVYQDGVPGRTVEMKLSESTASVEGDTSLQIEVENTNTGEMYTYRESSRIYQYTSNNRLKFSVPETRITYEHGALIRSDNRNSVMVKEPPMTFTDDYVGVTAVDIVGTDAVGGSGNTLTYVKERDSNLKHYDSEAAKDIKITVRVETDVSRARSWRRYLRSEGLTNTGNTDIQNGVVEFETTTRSVLIRRTIMDISIKR